MHIDFQELYNLYQKHYQDSRLNLIAPTKFPLPFTKKNSSLEFYNLGRLNLDNDFIIELSNLTHVTTLTLDALYEEESYDISYAPDDDSPASADTDVTYVDSVFPRLSIFIKSPFFNSVHTLIIKCNYTNDIEYNVYSISELIDIVKCLPRHVENLDISGVDLSQINISEIRSLFENIPGTIRSLSFTLKNLQGIQIALESLHTQLKELHLNDCNLFQDASNKIIDTIITTIPKQLSVLSLRRNWLYQMTPEHVNQFAKATANLEELDISHNQLNLNWGQMLKMLDTVSKTVPHIDISSNNLGTCTGSECLQFSSQLGPALRYLSMLDNQFNFEYFIPTLDKLSSNINEFDIFFSQPEFLEFPTALPSTIKIYNIKDIPTELVSLINCFKLIPSHIHTLRLPNNIIDNPEALSNLPNTIITLDISRVFLNTFDLDKALHLIRNIPPHVKKCIMHNNNLAYAGIDALTILFSEFHPEIEVDIAKNGFSALAVDKLNYQMETLLLKVPSKMRYCLDSNIIVRNDGKLQKALPLRPASFLHQPNINANQFKFAENLLLFTLLMHKYSLNNESSIHILSFIYAAGVNYKPDLQIIPANKAILSRSIIDQVRCRIHSDSQSTKLDLSRCGLNSLNLAEFKEIWRSIPANIIHLSVRGNGLHLSDEFRLALPDLPKHIQYLDMSANNFEQCDAQSLKEILKQLPVSILKVAINNEIPASPTTQIANRIWPLKTYKKLIDSRHDFLDIASTLLVGYVNNQLSWFSYWRNNHRNIAIKIANDIFSKKITTADDLLQQLEEIPLKNEAGDLGKIISFLLSLKDNSTNNNFDIKCTLYENSQKR